jgi:hypothetical protein
MYISTAESLLSLERVRSTRTGPVWRIRAAAANRGCLVAVHGRTTVRTTDKTSEQVANFVANQARRLHLTLSKGGWLRLNRIRGGGTLIRYRFGPLWPGVALEGEVRLEGESAKAWCRELSELL